MNAKLLYTLYFLYLTSDCALAYEALPRWGQAVVVINDALFVYGGKTDQYNSYSYTAAPNNNDLLYLSLSSVFEASSPPWQLISSSSNSSTSQGPALAWHTLSAFNTSEILLFGGKPGPNSPTVLVDKPDSGWLLNVFKRLNPDWIPEGESWAEQPIRRIHHSTATTLLGHVLIIGGEKADGSGNGFLDHYIFNPDGPHFTSLPAENSPPDISGHTSIILADGRVVVFGGYSQSQDSLLSLSRIWALDTTQSNSSWTMLNVSNSNLPLPRRAFASVLLGNGNILIHGGSDATLQNNFADGWILDTSQDPMVWTRVDGLSQLGPRRDHFSISYGNQVIFGFGYNDTMAAPAALQIYDIDKGSFTPTFTPPPRSSTPTQTLPGPSQTSKLPLTTSGTITNGNVHPTATLDPGDPNDGGHGQPNEDNSKKTTAIAVGTVFGFLGLIFIVVAGAYYIKRKRRNEDERKFMALNLDDDDDGRHSPHFGGGTPVAFTHDKHLGSGQGWNFGALGSIGLAGIINAARSPRYIRERRDILADEDTRDFGEWYYARRRDGTSGSSWSLKNMLGSRLRSREASIRTTGGTSRKDKEDPFSDGVALMRDGETAYVGVAGTSRPHERRQVSYTSTRSGRSYVDPFVDPVQEEPRDQHDDEVDKDQTDATQSYLRSTPPLLPFRTLSSPPVGVHPLSTLSEHTSTSQNTLSMNDPQTSISSPSQSDHLNSPFDTPSSRLTSYTSFEHPSSPGFATSSIIGAGPSTAQLMRRSDSWWTRFSRTSFLDRRASDASRRSPGTLEIRDPNPPPRLVAIEESTHSTSPDHNSSKSRSNSNEQGPSTSRKASGVYGSHNKSMTSVKTADTEAIERIAGTMDVIQRARTRTGSHRTSDSMSTAASLSIDTRPDSWSQHTGENDSIYREGPVMLSPSEMSRFESSSPFIEGPSVEPASLAAAPMNNPRQPRTTEGAVASRIQEFERRMSQDQEVSSPTNTKKWEERPRKKSHGTTVNYGLAPRANLYIANPDHRTNPSSDS